MPNIKSAIKRVRTSEISKAQNIKVKYTTRTAVKNAETAITANNANANETLVTAIKKLDKAASKGLIHKNAAARKKSRLTKKLNSLNA